MTNPSRHTEWLSLVEVSGPFLALPVLEKAFPQGLDVVETPKRQRLRAAYEEWCDAVEDNDPLLADLHREWIRLVFTEILEYDGSTLTTDAEKAKTYMVASPERTETFAPDWLVVSPSDGKPRLFVSIQPPGTDFERVPKDDGWPASLLERMAALCRSHAVRLGVITDGERWMLVNAPVGGSSSEASWYARLWFQEPVTLKAFQSLWSVRRCFGPSDETLEALLHSSLEHHEEITDTLGEQVRRAVEVLVQCLDKADADRNRELLRDVSPAELYEAGLTVMMRLVFVLCAEERGLLLSGDPVYDECYAVSTLRAQLAEEADRHGPEVLDRRHDAWVRLLSVFRAVHGGIDHESLRMPALGGSLFDPDRFPFLEGRSKGTSWRDSDAAPLPIDNRTVLLLLRSLQLLEQHGGALLLSYRALDVEQIGHVYEGLLEHTVARMPSVTIGLTGSKKAKNPNLPLAELESARMDGEDALVALVKETTERSESAIRDALARPVDETVFGRLLAVCGGDMTLAERIHPFANLVRTDAWDDPIVYREGAFMVTLGADRRQTGTHYTPKSLTESIVETTLEPVAYIGPAEGKPREEWKLKTPAELLELKICDPAMGSGAFLVQACRWLAERLVEAWAISEEGGGFVTADGEVKPSPGGADPLPGGMDERLLTGRRLIAERCLYGVDVNPLAVELAKLSIWLVTLAKGRPFGFLDHNLRHGDSLLGIHRLDQLTKLKLNPDDGSYQQRIFGQNVAGAVAEAVEIRKRLRAVPIRDIRDVETMVRLDAEARKKLQSIELVADAMIGEVLRANGKARAIESALDSLAFQADAFLKGDEKMGRTIAKEAHAALSIDLPDGKPARKPFHWPLEFAEVFLRDQSGFDAVVANPPWGAIISTNLQRIWKELHGDHLDRLIDSFHLFTLRAYDLTKNSANAVVGYLVPDVLLYQKYSQPLRRLLLSKTRIVEVCNIGGGVFIGVTRPCCYIVFLKKVQAVSFLSVATWPLSGPREQHGQNVTSISQSALLAFPGNIIPTNSFDNFAEVTGYVSTIPCKLSDLVDEHGIQRGVSADNKDVFVVTEEIVIKEHLERDWIRRVVTGGIHLKPFKIDSDLPLLIYTNRDTRQEEIPCILQWVSKNAARITCKEVKQGKHPIYSLHRPRDPDIFEKDVKILGVITSDRPIVSVDENGLYAMDGIYVFSPRRSIDPYFLSGVLNSKLMAMIYQVFSQEEDRVMAQVKPTIIAQLPIVPPNSGDEELNKLASEISFLSKALHKVESVNSETEMLLTSLDNLVETLFSRAMEFYEQR